jgi:hypothetical protein
MICLFFEELYTTYKHITLSIDATNLVVYYDLRDIGNNKFTLLHSGLRDVTKAKVIVE